MSNWTPITEAAIKSAKNAAVLAKVRQIASASGDEDPLPPMIADIVAQIRAACSTGNQLDVDTAKIPNSLLGLGKRMVIRELKDFIQMGLSPDETAKAAEDRSYLNRIIDSKIRFEVPDQAAAGGEMQSSGGIDIATVSEPFATRKTMNGLL